MDPFAIVSAAPPIAIQAVRVATTLYHFFKDARSIHRKATEFRNDIEGFRLAYRQVDKHLQRVVKESQNWHQEIKRSSQHEDEQLWKSLESQLSDGKEIVAQLEDAVSCIAGMDKRQPNFFEKALRQIQLSMKDHNIAEARSRIYAHTLCMHTTLLVVAIENLYLIPQRVEVVFQTRLAKFLEELDENKAELKQFHAYRPSIENTAQCKNEVCILEISERVMSSGSSLYEESLTNGSDNGTLPTHRSRSIQDWVESSSRSSVLTSVSPSVFSSYGGVHLSRTETTASLSTERPSHRGLRNPSVTTIERRCTDAQDIYSAEPAKQLVGDGFSFFEMKDYPKARSMLDAAMAVIPQLSASKQETFRLYELRYMLSVCIFYTEDPPAAEAELLNAIREGKDVSELDYDRQVQICHASHLLAITYVRLGKMDLARKYCQASYLGGVAISGRTNPFYDASLALMDRILHIQSGSPSKFYTTMILDEEQRNSLTRSFEDLYVSETPRSGLNADLFRVQVDSQEPEQIARNQPQPEADTTRDLQQTSGTSVIQHGQDEETLNNPIAPATVHTPLEDPARLNRQEEPRSTSLHERRDSFLNPDLATLAQSVGFAEPGRPDIQTRRKWMSFIRAEAKSDLSRALMLGDTVKAIQMMQSDPLKRHRMFSRSTSKFQKEDMYLAALFGEAKVVDQLISLLGPNGRIARQDGLTVLHCAAIGGHFNIARSS